MAGERLPLYRSSNSTDIAGAHQKQMHGDGFRVADGGMRRDEAGHAGKGGKLRLSHPALFKKKPYDRPAHPGALDRPLSSGLNGPAPSLPARLVDSASNLITTSASYLFESFFKRRQTLWIGNGIRSTARTDSADTEHKKGSKPPIDNFDREAVTPLQGPACREKAEEEDLDLAKVEGILQQQILSREEVKRLTDALQNGTHGGNVVDSNSEAYRRQEKMKQVGEELNPVQLAKAFMGKRTSHFVSTSPQWQSTPYQYGEGAGPSSIKRIKEEVYERSSGQASKAHPASTERMLKRRLIADDEDNVIPRGPTRRVRQRMTITANTSPYIRQVTTASRSLRTSSMPLISERSEKAEEALEESTLPAKGKSVEEPAILVTCDDADPPESSKARENLETFSTKDSLVLPTSSDLDNSSCKPAVEPVATIASKATEESAIGSLAASPSELPTIIPERTKGFHMSALFEDSSSDEDCEPPVKAQTSSEAQQPGSSISQGALQDNIKNQPFALISSEESFPSAADPTKKSSPLLLQPSIAAGPSNTNSNGLSPASSLAAHSSDSSPSTLASALAMGKSIPLLSNIPVLSHVPSATEREFLPLNPALAGAPSSVVLSEPPISASPSRPTPLPATSVSFSVQGGTVAAVAPSSSAAEVEPMWKVAAAEGVTAEASGLSPMTASPPAIARVAETASIIAPIFTAPATASKSFVALVTTPESVSPVESVVSSAAVPAIVPMVFQAGAQADSVTAADSFLKAGSGVTFTSGSPGADRQGEGDTMATDPMTEEPASSFVPSSASPFLFGSASTAPMSLGQMPSFGSDAAATSPFSFPMLVSVPSGASSSPFSSQSSTTAGQFTFGASGALPSNPFSVNTQSSFPFGSSAAASVSPVFTATSSAPLTFPATPAGFVAHAASSSSTSSTSMFGAQMTSTASAFATPDGQTNAPAFLFSTPPTSSGTPTPPPFQFGGAGASGPSFGGQSFTFGGQPAGTAGNPFAQFGSSAATPSQSVFSSGATAPLTVSFGAQPSGSPFPFAFGSQPGAPPTGQPVSFGRQPAAAAQSAIGQSPFASVGASGMDFGGGFSLGAAGGERPGRKFIKAKRNVGAKRGK